MDKKVEISDRLKDFLRENSITNADFAKALDMPRQNIYPYLKGSSIPGGELLSKISELGCDINWLLTGKKFSGIKEPLSEYSRLASEEQLKIYNEYLALLKKENERLQKQFDELEDQDDKSK